LPRINIRVQSVEPREDFIVNIHFTDGSQREINLEPYLRGPVSEALLNDPSLFRSMRVEEGTITWPNGADIDPDVLYYGLTPSWAASSEASNTESQSL
jgi:hypothetical protein